MFSARRHSAPVLYTTICAMLAGCVAPSATLAPSIAQPGTRPARNFTSFSDSLRCMDALFLQSKRPRILISSTDIPDETRDIDVGSDDMLINAISQMNARSGSYQFLDQGLYKDGGLLQLQISREDDVTPQLYIRGSISQLDSAVTDDNIDVEWDAASGTNRGITGAKFGPYRKLSVVSVDMHLVAYPSRRVLPGASVANSMVVVERGFGAGASGLINLSELGISLEINRVESQSQAVRNLIELGLIELLGKHSGVPYWSCLSLPQTDAKAEKKRERKFENTPDPQNIAEAQTLLMALGFYQGAVDNVLGPETRAAISRFQASEALLPNGIVDFDLLQRLRKRLAAKTSQKQKAKT